MLEKRNNNFILWISGGFNCGLLFYLGSVAAYVWSKPNGENEEAEKDSLSSSTSSFCVMARKSTEKNPLDCEKTRKIML